MKSPERLAATAALAPAMTSTPDPRPETRARCARAWRPSRAQKAGTADPHRRRAAEQPALRRRQSPRGALVAITGVSGSGKSSLAFDTLLRGRGASWRLSPPTRASSGRPPCRCGSIEGLSLRSLSTRRASLAGTDRRWGRHGDRRPPRVLYARAGTARQPWCDLPREAEDPRGRGAGAPRGP